MVVPRTAHSGGKSASQALDGVRSGGFCNGNSVSQALDGGLALPPSSEAGAVSVKRSPYGSERGGPGDRHPYRDQGDREPSGSRPGEPRGPNKQPIAATKSTSS